jgi:RNA polymerase sigma-70 factor, ECF subfamily
VNDERETFESLRPLLFAIAYRMLASVSDSEDVLQEAYLRWRRAVNDGAEIESLKAYLSTVVTRLAMDQLRSARVRREEYVGLWLPEPLPTGAPDVATGGAPTDDPLARAERTDSLSMAFLLVLERLSPIERAAFLLHDVFAYTHDEIAAIVETTPANARQIASRARRRVQAERPRFDPSPAERDRLAERFFAALSEGDVDGLVQVLADDVVVYGDGGGKVPQWATPIVGVERVAKLFAALGAQMRQLHLRVERRSINEQPAAAVLDATGALTNVFVLDIADGRVRAVRSVINPDKLRHLGPVADVRALAARRQLRPRPSGS